MAESTRTAEQQEQERQRQQQEQQAARNVPRQGTVRGAGEQQAAEPPQDARAVGRREREETDKLIAERLATPPEPPTPTQDEADAIKEAAFSGNLQPEEPAAPETEEQRRERERQQRDVRPAEGRPGYTTR
jgi:hypothetical protein